MYSARPIGANESGASDHAVRSDTFWQSMGNEHAFAASKAEFARVFRARPRYRRRLRVRESPLATGDGLPA